MALSKLTVICCFAMLVLHAAAYSDTETYEKMNPFVRQENSAVQCKTLRIPWNLCTACRLKPFEVKAGGVVDFGGINRFDIYDLSTPRCRNMLKRYVEYNECDTVRKNALETLDTNPASYRAMIYFMYAVCELCCDCIPIGSLPSEYEERKKAGTLWTVRRGNCPAHFWYDTCRIWPNSSQIVGLKSNPDDVEGNWCPQFKTWQFSPDAKGWLKNNDVPGITDDMADAMESVLRVTNCGEETTWKQCLAMEKGQNRV